MVSPEWGWTATLGSLAGDRMASLQLKCDNEASEAGTGRASSTGYGRATSVRPYFNERTTGPATGSVTPNPPPRSSSDSRKLSSVAII